jgi:fructokinase
MIVVCGEALADVFVDGANAHGLQLTAHNGGSPFNVAIGLARIGMPAMFFGGLSIDVFGARLADALRIEGVDLGAAPRPPAKTALVCVAPDSNGSPTYTFYSDQSAERMVYPADLPRLPAQMDALHVGSYCMVAQPVAGTLRVLVERQRGRSLIAYDPNVRLTIEPALDAWRSTLEWMAARADLLKISEEDLECLYPGQPVEEFMTGALALGVALVVVTRGARGALARSASGVAAEVAATPTTVVDTVGAGDSFQAALIAWLVGRGARGADTRTVLTALDQAALGDALGYASRAAAITCGRRGANLPYGHELSGG